MANRFFPAAVGGLILSALLGCQPGSTTAMDYPAPSFDAPRMIVAPRPTYVYVPPKIVVPPAVRSPVAVTASAVIVRPRPVVAGNSAWLPPVAPRPWRYIVIHHSDTTTGGAVAFDKMHRAKGWDELGYDFVIGNGTDTANGQVEVGPRWVKQKVGAHAKTPDNRFNEYGIGICMVGNFMVERPTAKQIESLDHLVGYLMATYHIPPDHVLGHGDTKNTLCPGKYVNLPFIRQQAALLAGYKIGGQMSASADDEMLTNVVASK